MMTVGHPGPGAIGAPCIERSPTRAAGKPPISTVMLPCATPLGAGDTHTIPPGIPLATAAGWPPMRTVATAAAGVTTPPPCGFGPSNSGQSAESPARRAGPVGTGHHAGAGVTSSPVMRTAERQRVGVRAGGAPTTKHCMRTWSV